MSHNRGSAVFRAMTVIGITAFVLASCGGTDSSSNRNGRLNSTLCFDTQEQKDQAIADAQQNLDGAVPPTLEDAFSDKQGTRANLAFIRPQLWWMHYTVDETTTTTSPTSSSSSSSSTTLASTTESTAVSSDSTSVSSDSTDVPSETSVPLVEDMELQRLQDALDAATNAPLCGATDSSIAQATFHKCVASWTYGQVDGLSAEPSVDAGASQDCNATLSRCILSENSNTCSVTAESNGVQVFATTLDLTGMHGGESRVVTFEWTDGDVVATNDTTIDTTVDTTVDTGSTITCTANVTSNGASFKCDRELQVNFFYFLAGGNESGSQWGNQDTVFGPIENVRDIYLGISNGSVGVFNQFAAPGTYEFQVPEVVPVPEPEPNTQQLGAPYFEGVFTPAALTTTFTISVLDGAPVYVYLYAPCETPTIEATISIDGKSIDFSRMPSFMLNEGLCGVYFESEFGLPAGDYVVSVDVSAESEIEWYAEVESISLSNDSETNQKSPSDVTYTLTTQQVDADQTFTIDVPAGGLWFTARGNTNQGCSSDLRIDPYLILLDDQNRVIVHDDSGAEVEDSNCYASFIETRLDEGTYYLVATTYDLQNPADAWDDALTQYELVYGLETSETITSPADLAEAVTPSADAPTIVLPSTEYKLPVESIVVDGNNKTDSGVPVIPIGVTSMLCTNDCISTLFENAGIDAVSIELSAGGESVVVTRTSRKVRVPVARGATSITAIAKSADGATVAEMSSQVHQMSMNDVAMMSNTDNTTIKPSESKPVDSQNNLRYVLAALVFISILFVLNSRRKGAVTKG